MTLIIQIESFRPSYREEELVMQITFKDLAVRIGQAIVPEPFCVETGASYTRLPENEANLVHTSTHNIVWHIAKPNNGMLWTYDHSVEHLEICRAGLGADVSYWKGVPGESVEQLLLSNFPRPVDFVHLDSKEGDEDYMVQEFLALEPYLSPNAIVCCDDIHNPPSVKWKKAVPLLKTKARSFTEVPTNLGTFVAFMGSDIASLQFDKEIICGSR